MLTVMFYHNDCAVPESILSHPMDGQWKFLVGGEGRGGEGVPKAKLFKGEYTAKLEFS